MAKILSQDPQTGFVTLQLDDGRTTVAPADVAYQAFPDVRAPTPVPDMPLPSGPAASAITMAPDPVNQYDPAAFQAEWGAAPEPAPAPEQPMPVVNDELRQARYADTTSFASPLATMQRTPNGAFGAPREGGARSHTGVDYAGREGDPVLAMGPGVVVSAGFSEGDGGKGGNRVWIDYGNGLRSASMHLRDVHVRPGDQVQQGQAIGTVGNTGTSSSGPHLHQVYEVNGQRVDEPEFLARVGGSDKFSVNMNTAAITGPPGATTAPVAGGFNALGGQLAAATDAKRQALMAQGGIRMAMTQGQTEAAQATEDLMRREGERRAVAQQQIQEQLAMEDARIQQALDSIPQADPHQFWNSRDGFTKVLGVAGAALAGFLNPGGKNVVVETVQQLIQDDLRAQETNIQTARQRVGAMESRYNRVAGRLEMDELAKREMSLYKLETVKAALATKMAQFASPLTQAEYAGAIAELDAASVAQRAELLGMWNQHMLAQSNFELDRWYKNEQVKLEKGRLGLSIAEANQKALEAKGKGGIGKTAVIGKSTGFTINGQDIIAPGADDKLAAESQGQFERRGLAANKVWEAAEYLKSLKKDFVDAKVKPDKAKIAQASAMLETAIAEMTETSIARASDRDMQRIKDAAGSNITSFVALMDADIFDEMVQRMQTNTVEDMNRFGQAKGPLQAVDGAIGDVQWNPPEVTYEWQAGRENPVTLERELSQMRPGGPRTRALEPGTGVIPKEPKRGEDQKDYAASKKGAKNAFTEETAKAAVAKANALANAVREGRVPASNAVAYAKQLAEQGQEFSKAGFKTQAGELYSIAAGLATFEPQRVLQEEGNKIRDAKAAEANRARDLLRGMY